jgi:long-chain acyl-CoA synthetase
MHSSAHTPADHPLDTFPKRLLDRAQRHPHKIAMREKDLGIWQEWSWLQMLDEIRAFACGLAVHGLQRGDKVAIVGDNRPQLYWAMTATQCLGGIPVPLYQDAGADEIQFVLDHAEVRFAVVEDQEQVDKLLSVWERCPTLETLIFHEPRGLRHYDEPFLHAFEAVQQQGRSFDAEHPEFFGAQAAMGTGGDLGIILYTSGTTGRPKGVMLSYDNIIITSCNAATREGLHDDEEIVSYLPMAWVGDHILSYGQF